MKLEDFILLKTVSYSNMVISSCPSAPLQNLDDSVFSKRHAKLELDEKRRKR